MTRVLSLSSSVGLSTRVKNMTLGIPNNGKPNRSWFKKGHGLINGGSKGKHWKLTKEQIKIRTLSQSGENHWRWSKTNVSYDAIHSWLMNQFGTADKCENTSCFYPRMGGKGKVLERPKRYEWAKLKDKEYERKRENFIMLCPSCHRKYDLGIVEISLKLAN